MEKLTSKRRSELRGLAQTISPVVMVGHDGISSGVVQALIDALDCHELVKVRFQDFKEDTKVLSLELEEKTDSTLVATTGFTAVFYKKSQDKRH